MNSELLLVWWSIHKSLRVSRFPNIAALNCYRRYCAYRAAEGNYSNKDEFDSAQQGAKYFETMLSLTGHEDTWQPKGHMAKDSSTTTTMATSNTTMATTTVIMNIIISNTTIVFT